MRDQTEVYVTSNLANIPEESVDDDDAHFCLRCHATVHGLERYVLHRKSKCAMSESSSENLIPQTSSSSDPILHVYDLNMSSQARPDPVLSISSNHIDGRLKLNQNEANLATALSVAEVTSEELMSHLGLSMVSSSSWAADINTEEPLRADDFFSMLELQSCSKTLKALEMKGQNQRISGNKISESTDANQEETAVESSEAPLETTASPDIPAENEQPNQETENISQAEDTNAGRWLPEYNTLAVTTTQEEHWDSSTNSSSAPAPYPSRGKWMPGSKPWDIHKTGSSVEYHCKPCNRRLTNRHVYERHLQSELHFKKVSQNSSSEQEGLYSLRRKRSPGWRLDQIDLSDDDSDMSWMRRKRRWKDGLRCKTCLAWVPENAFGKHLVSRFHVLRSRNHPGNVDYILEHMDLIVREAPFQCSLCRFYSHSHSNLVVHWKSVDHAERNAVSQGTFYCSVCQLSCATNMQMQLHLESHQHLECVAVINKSIPVVISKPHFVQCHLCLRKFRYRIQLNKHVAATHQHHHLQQQQVLLTEATHDPGCFSCDICHFTSASKAALIHHRFSHATSTCTPLYQCLICKLSFGTRSEAQKHRSTQQHRDAARSGKAGKPKERSCPHCYEIFSDVEDFRKHLKEEHRALLPRCTTCGAQFILKQELSAHRRTNCRRSASIHPEENASYSCDICSCTCSSRADVLYHKAVEHQQSLEKNPAGRNEKFACVECGLHYTKSALKMHVLVHTQELPFRCSFCARRFSNQPDLHKHLQILHKKT